MSCPGTDLTFFCLAKRPGALARLKRKDNRSATTVAPLLTVPVAALLPASGSKHRTSYFALAGNIRSGTDAPGGKMQRSYSCPLRFCRREEARKRKKGEDCPSLLWQASFVARRFGASRTAMTQSRRRLLRLMSLNGYLFFFALPGLPAFVLVTKEKYIRENPTKNK